MRRLPLDTSSNVRVVKISASNAWLRRPLSPLGDARTMLLIALALLGSPGALVAQVHPDRDAIALLTVVTVQRDVLDGQPFTLDPEYFLYRPEIGLGSPDSLAPHVVSETGAAAVLGMKDARVCETDAPPRSCRLSRGIAAIAITKPEINGDSALVWAEVRQPAPPGARAPIVSITVRLDFRRVRGTWTVSRSEVERIT